MIGVVSVPSIVVGIAPVSEMESVDGEEDQSLETENTEPSSAPAAGGTAAGGSGGPTAGADDDAGKSRALRRPRLKSQRSLGRENETREERNTKESSKQPQQQQQQQQQLGRGTVHKHTLKVLGRSHAR